MLILEIWKYFVLLFRLCLCNDNKCLFFFNIKGNVWNNDVFVIDWFNLGVVILRVMYSVLFYCKWDFVIEFDLWKYFKLEFNI